MASSCTRAAGASATPRRRNVFYFSSCAKFPRPSSESSFSLELVDQGSPAGASCCGATRPANGGDDGVPLSGVCRRIKIGAHLGLVSASLLAPRSGRGRAAVANHHNHKHTKCLQGRQPDRRFPPVVVVVEEFVGAVAGRCFRCRGSRLLGQTRAGLQSAGR